MRLSVVFIFLFLFAGGNDIQQAGDSDDDADNDKYTEHSLGHIGQIINERVGVELDARTQREGKNIKCGNDW